MESIELCCENTIVVNKNECEIFFLYSIKIRMTSVESGSERRCDLFIVTNAEPHQCFKINCCKQDIVAWAPNWKFDYVQYDLISLFRFWFSSKIFLHAFIFNSVIIMVCLQTVWRFGFVNKLNEIVERGKLIETLVWEQSTTYRIEYMSVSFSIGSAQILQPSVFRNFQKRSPKMRILEQFFFYKQLHQENQFDQLSML